MGKVVMQKKFNTTFNSEGWQGFYIAGTLFSLFGGAISTTFSYLFVGDFASAIGIKVGLSVIKILITTVFYAIAYTKIILLFVNTTTLEGKKVSTTLTFSSFFSVVISNIIICIATFGIYTPWAYKSIIDKLADSIESEEGGRFAFSSQAHILFSFLIVSIILIFFTFSLSILSFVLMGRFSARFVWPLALIGMVMFVAFLASICAMEVFMINWFINISYILPDKKTTYTLKINNVSAILFVLGQIMLLAITFGFYAGMFVLNMYEFFVNRIEEKEDGVPTGRLFFVKPLDKGALFLFSQLLLSVITAGLYVPFAYVQYARFFINNTYLQTKGECNAESSKSDK